MTRTTNNHAVTILEALAWAGEKLKVAFASTSAQNPKLDAQVLLAEVLCKPASYLFAHGEETLEESDRDHFQRLVERRARHEPVAYLIGRKEFYGRPFFVNQSVLIPRPETEIMVDIIKSFATPMTTIVDIGTGSGAIAATLALETPSLVLATDTDARALAVARQNAETLGATVAFFQGHLFAKVAEHLSPVPAHLIIAANLPYLSPWQVNALDPDVREYEPRHALIGGPDGLALYDELFGQLRHYCHEASRRGLPVKLDIVFEIDPSQRVTAPALAKEHFPDAAIELIADYANHPRHVIVRI